MCSRDTVSRRIRRATLVWGFSAVVSGLLTLATPPNAWAHTDPPGANSTGITITMTAFRNDGITSVLPGTVTECETIKYRATLTWAGGQNASFERGLWTITTPDGVVHDVTPVGGVPCLGDPVNSTDDPNSVLNDGRGLCAGTPGTINSDLVTYTVRVIDIDGFGDVPASTALTAAFAHLGDEDTDGVAAGTPFSLPVERCTDNVFCNGLETCDPTLAEDSVRLGLCVPGTPPTCDDGNACTTDLCDTQLDECVNTDISADCNDGNACTADSCVPATGCVNTDNSARCEDSDVCTDDRCDPVTGCVNTDNSARCDDSDVCTDDRCDPVNGCVNTPNNLCEGCLTRTPGFWGTHPRVTALFLSIESCGLTLDTKVPATPGSVTEDLCFSAIDAKANNTSPQQLQLIRQCAAAALNFAASTEGGGSCDNVVLSNGATIAAVFNRCCDEESLCTIGASGTRIGNSGCIGLLDEFNNSDDTIDCTTLDPSSVTFQTFCPSLGANGFNANPKRCDEANGNGFVNPGRTLGPK